MAEWVIGVDLGGTKTAFGLISPDNRIVSRRKIPTNESEGPASIVERIAQVVDEFGREVPAGKKIEALGICTPGPVDHVTGDLFTLVNLPSLANTPLRRMLADRLNLPVRLD